MANNRERHSFIVHVWMEKRASNVEGELWRGYVTHVATGRRHYVHSMSEIPVFIRAFLGDREPRRQETGRDARSRK